MSKERDFFNVFQTRTVPFWFIQRTITKWPWEELLFNSSFIYHFSEIDLSKIIPRWCIAGTFSLKSACLNYYPDFCDLMIFQLDCIMLFFPWRLEKNIYHTIEISRSLSAVCLHQTCKKRDLTQTWKCLDLIYKSRSQTEPFSGVLNCSVHHTLSGFGFFAPIYNLSSKI